VQLAARFDEPAICNYSAFDAVVLSQDTEGAVEVDRLGPRRLTASEQPVAEELS